MEIKIGIATLAVSAIAAAAAFLMPALLWLFLRKKTSARALPLIAGVIAYIAIAFARGIANAFLINESLKHSPWLAYLVMALISGVLEETGRFIVFRHIINGYGQTEDALSYGMGHCGLELMMVYGFGGSSLSNFFLGTVYKIGGLKPFADANCNTDETLMLMKSFAENGLRDNISVLYDCVSGLAFQLAMTLLVFAAVHYAGDKKLLFEAVAIHTVIDFMSAFYFLGYFNLWEKIFVDLLLTAAACYFAYRVCSFYTKPQKKLSEG